MKGKSARAITAKFLHGNEAATTSKIACRNNEENLHIFTTYRRLLPLTIASLTLSKQENLIALATILMVIS